MIVKILICGFVYEHGGFFLDVFVLVLFLSAFTEFTVKYKIQLTFLSCYKITLLNLRKCKQIKNEIKEKYTAHIHYNMKYLV